MSPCWTSKENVSPLLGTFGLYRISFYFLSFQTKLVSWTDCLIFLVLLHFVLFWWRKSEHVKDRELLIFVHFIESWITWSSTLFTYQGEVFKWRVCTVVPGVKERLYSPGVWNQCHLEPYLLEQTAQLPGCLYASPPPTLNTGTSAFPWVMLYV